MTEVLIDGINMQTGSDETTALVNYQVIDDIDSNGIQEKRAEIVVDRNKYLALVGSLSTGLSCTIKRGTVTATDNWLLNGQVTNIIKQNDLLIIVARNLFWRLTKLEINKSYDSNIDTEAGELSAIWEDVISDADIGISTSAVSSGTGTDEIRVKYPIKNRKRSDILDEITKTLSWVQYFRDSNTTAYLEPEGTTVYGTDLVVGDNIINIPAWNYDYEAAVNYVKVIGASRRDWNVQEFSGDASETQFTLTYEPKDTEIYVDTVLQVRGITGASATFDYSVDEQNKQINFEAASTPGIGVDNVVVNYSRDVPQAVIARSDSSISQLGFTSQQSYYFDDLRDINDAIQKANSILDNISFGFVGTTLEINDIYDIYVGYQVHVIDSIQNEDRYLTVKNITYRYPEHRDSIEVGDKRFKLTQILNEYKKKISELNKQGLATQEYINQLFNIFSFQRLGNRYFMLLTRDTTPDGIWGRGFGNGVTDSLYWGVAGAVWQNSYTNSQVTSQIVQGNNIYDEYLYDDDFLDSGNTTATWSTALQRISFTSGQVAQTSAIAKGTTYNYFTVELGTVTGTLTVEISGDNGANWQTVTLAARSSFSVSDSTGVLLRITEAGSTTATIENLKDSNNNYFHSAIYLKLEE